MNAEPSCDYCTQPAVSLIGESNHILVCANHKEARRPMTADHWTHHDPAVRELIRAAQAEAWDEGHEAGGRDVFEREEQGYNRPRIVNPYREAAR